MALTKPFGRGCSAGLGGISTSPRASATRLGARERHGLGRRRHEPLGRGLVDDADHRALRVTSRARTAAASSRARSATAGRVAAGSCSTASPR